MLKEWKKMMSERERERNTKRFFDEEEGWRTVGRKRNHGGGRQTLVAGHSKVQGGVKWWQTKGPSIFVDNLPDFYDRYLLRKLFKGCGKVEDCHIPGKKRINTNTRFGFVFFMKEEDGLLAARSLNGVRLFGHVITVKKSFINGELKPKLRKEKEQVYLSSHAGKDKGKLSYAEALLQKRKGIWIKKSEVERGMYKPTDFLELKNRGNENDISMTVLKADWEELLHNQSQLKTKIEKLELQCQAIQAEVIKMREEKNEREGRKEEEEGFMSEEEEAEGSNDMVRNEEETLLVAETVLEGNNGGLLNEEEEKIEEERRSPVYVEENCEMAAAFNLEGREEVVSAGSDTAQKQKGEDSDGFSNLLSKEKILKNKKKYYHNFLRLNPLSMRHKYGGTSVKGKGMRKKKKKVGPCWGDSCYNEENESVSCTMSAEPELGDEFYNRLRREKQEEAKNEAKRTVEIGRKVGVVFKPNPSSTIDKLMEMEK